MPMNNSFEVNSLDKGYEIAVWDRSREDEDFYPDPVRGIATTPEEVKKYLDRYLENNGVGFTFED